MFCGPSMSFLTHGKRFDQPPHHPFPKPPPISAHFPPCPLLPVTWGPLPRARTRTPPQSTAPAPTRTRSFLARVGGGVRVLEGTHVGLVLKGHQKDTHKLWLVSLFERKPETWLVFGGCLCLGTLVGLVLKGNQRKPTSMGVTFRI